jgi:hypothetical protein
LGEAQQHLLQTRINVPVVLKGEDTYFCHILLRDDILYSFDIQMYTSTASQQVSDSKLGKNSGSDGGKDDTKVNVAIGMPTLSVSVLKSWEEIAPLRLFLPSFINSVTSSERQQFRYHFYIGYDMGDRYLDDPDVLTMVNNKMINLLEKAEFDAVLHFVRFPYSKGWVSYLWNGLFVQAMRQGCDYFYQVSCDGPSLMLV